MNFHAVATEIMLTANEEKWYETREKIAAAVKAGYELGQKNCLLCAIRAGNYTYAPFPTEQHQGGGSSGGCRPDPWRDQPDGVR